MTSSHLRVPETSGMNEKPVVVLTGFGPFGQYKTNASWEVVKAVKDLGVDDLGIHLETKEIQVSYKTVLEEIPKLWLEFKPTLVIHLGVSAAATELTIESCAHKSGYRRCDVSGKLPPDGKCVNGVCEDVYSELDLQKVVGDMNNTNIGVSATISNNAGRYLCEFIYYTSLCIDNRHTLFIHVPDIGKPYTLEQMAQGIKVIIGSIMDQIGRNSNCENVQLSAQDQACSVKCNEI
ncbi:hypothetical protein R5R35_000581 [Gryllus longicercus]